MGGERENGRRGTGGGEREEGKGRRGMGGGEEKENKEIVQKKNVIIDFLKYTFRQC